MEILKTMLKESNIQIFEWFIVAEDLIVTSVRLQLVGWFIVFNATFNNISVISWRSVLLVEETEKTTNLSQVTDKVYHIMLYLLQLDTLFSSHRWAKLPSLGIRRPSVNSFKSLLLWNHWANLNQTWPESSLGGSL